MEIAEFYYKPGEDVATSRTTIPSGEYYLHSISYPNLTKVISEPGIYSSNGENTREIRFLSRPGANTILSVQIPEGLHSSSELVSYINEGLRRFRPVLIGGDGTFDHIPQLEFVPFGSSQYYVKNDNTTTVAYFTCSNTLKKILAGNVDVLFDDPDTGDTLFKIEPFSNTIPQIFTPDPFLGNHSTVLQIQNGDKIMLSNSNEWLSGGTLYFHEKTKINFNNTNIVELYADFPSINTYKRLLSPRDSVIKIVYTKT